MRFLGVEQVLTLDGRRYRLGRLTIFLLRRWLDWAVEQIDPPALDHVSDLSLDAVEFFEDVAETWHTLGNPRVQAVYDSDHGQAQLWCLLFDKHHWDIDPLPLLAHCEHPVAVIERAGGLCVPTEQDTQAEFLRLIGKWQPEEDDGERTRWEDQFAALFQNVYLPPHVVGEMTMAELATVCRAKRTQEDMLELAFSYARLPKAQKKAMALYRIGTLMRA